MDCCNNVLEELKDKPLVLFGASKCGKRAVNYLSKAGVKINYFCDNDSDKWRKRFLNIDIISPKQLCEIEGGFNILITSSYFTEIAYELKALGFKNIFYYNYNILENKNKIKKLFHILADDKSREVLFNILNYRLTRNLGYIRKVAENDQYFPDDIIRFDDNEVFVDGGAFKGYTLLRFITKVNNNFNKCFSFEPDKKNYKKLNKFIQDYKLKNVFIYNKGLFNRDGSEKFLSQESGSRINNDKGNEEIKVIKLDNFLKNEKITFVKMDIEGAELEALQGSKNIIKKNKPKLAICLYHKPNDLWEIPLFINSLNSEYKIYIRHHSFNKPFETVCYAVT